MWLSGHYPAVIQRLSTEALAKNHSSVFSRSWHANDKTINETNETFFFWNFVMGFANHVTRRPNDFNIRPTGYFSSFSFIQQTFLESYYVTGPGLISEIVEGGKGPHSSHCDKRRGQMRKQIFTV